MPSREILAQSRHTTVKVLPKYVKRTTKQIATGTRKRRAANKRRTFVRMSSSMLVRMENR